MVDIGWCFDGGIPVSVDRPLDSLRRFQGFHLCSQHPQHTARLAALPALLAAHAHDRLALAVRQLVIHQADRFQRPALLHPLRRGGLQQPSGFWFLQPSLERR